MSASMRESMKIAMSKVKAVKVRAQPFCQRIEDVVELARKQSAENVSILSDSTIQSARRLFYGPATYIINGPNNVGKSAYINNIIGQNLLESMDGKVTGRILRLEYAELKDSCIFLVNANNQEIDGTRVSLANLTEKELINEVKKHTARPIKGKLGSDEYYTILETWCESIIVLRIPNELLAIGIELIDTPGFNCIDNEIIQDTMTKFMASQDTSVVFMFIHPAVGDDEISALSILKTACFGDHRPPFFFINSFADLSTFSDHPVNWDKKVDTVNDALEKNIANRRALFHDGLIDSNTGLHELLTDYNFGIVSNEKTNPKFLSPAELALYNAQRDRLVNTFAVWAVKAEALRVIRKLNVLISGLQVYRALIREKDSIDLKAQEMNTQKKLRCILDSIQTSINATFMPMVTTKITHDKENIIKQLKACDGVSFSFYVMMMGKVMKHYIKKCFHSTLDTIVNGNTLVELAKFDVDNTGENPEQLLKVEGRRIFLSAVTTATQQVFYLATNSIASDIHNSVIVNILATGGFGLNKQLTSTDKDNLAKQLFTKALGTLNPDRFKAMYGESLFSFAESVNLDQLSELFGNAAEIIKSAPETSLLNTVAKLLEDLIVLRREIEPQIASILQS